MSIPVNLLRSDLDWRLNPDRFNLRKEILGYLLRSYGRELSPDGSSMYESGAIYTCADAWLSQGNSTMTGLDDFFHEFYEQYSKVKYPF